MFLQTWVVTVCLVCYVWKKRRKGSQVVRWLCREKLECHGKWLYFVESIHLRFDVYVNCFRYPMSWNYAIVMLYFVWKYYFFTQQYICSRWKWYLMWIYNLTVGPYHINMFLHVYNQKNSTPRTNRLADKNRTTSCEKKPIGLRIKGQGPFHMCMDSHTNVKSS